MKVGMKCKFGVCPANFWLKGLLKKCGFVESKKKQDFIFVVGGDGTFLQIAKKKDVPLVFLRDKLSVGALAEYSVDEIKKVVKNIKESNYRIEEMMRIEVNGKPAFSDIYITHTTGAESIQYEIEGRNFYDIRIATGIIFSTPQGTTGYTQSAGGPVVKKKRIVVTHICPYNKVKLKGKVVDAPPQRWHILKANKKVTFRLLWPEKAAIHIDGKRVGTVRRGEEVEIKRYEKDAKIVRFGKETKYINTVDCVVEENGKILLVTRRFEPFKGKLALPGGIVESGESEEEALKRELKEETGLDAIGVIEFGHYWGPKRDPRGPTYTVAFTADTKGRLEPGRETKKVGWYDIREIKPSDLAFDHWKILYDYFRWTGRIIGQ